VGEPISGLDGLPGGVLAFHGGTARRDGHLVTAGGRVITLVGSTREAVYAAAAAVQFDGKHYRSDIGLEAQPAAAVAGANQGAGA
jgi:phosphoribosylamine--glycine ligase